MGMMPARVAVQVLPTALDGFLPRSGGPMLHVYIDADACPVKDETYKVARRYGLNVTLVANTWMRTPQDGSVNLVVVKGDWDAADDWIAENAGEGDVVVTADVPLAARCVAKRARVIGPRGQEFTEDSVGDAVATRDLLAQLREAGVVSTGPPPFDKRDRSRFLQTLDTVVQSIRGRSS